MVGDSPSTDSGNSDFISGGLDFLREESGNAGSGENFIDPASLGNDEYERDDNGNLVYGVSGKPRKKRGRKSGGSNGSASGSTQKRSGNSKAVSGIETLSQTLMIFHMGLASITKFDGFNLEKKESDALSHSIANVMEQFDWAPDPRFTAISGLVMTGATIYGPRLYMLREHNKEQRNKRRQEQSTDIPTSNIVDLTGMNFTGG